MKRSLLPLLIFLGCLLAALETHAAATTYDWTGALSTDWSTPGNWKIGAVTASTAPGNAASDIARIGFVGFSSGNQPTLNSGATVTITTLTIGGATPATLTLSSALTVSGIITISSSNISLGATTLTLTNNSNSALTFSTGTCNISGATGTVNLTQGGIAINNSAIVTLGTPTSATGGNFTLTGTLNLNATLSTGAATINSGSIITTTAVLTVTTFAVTGSTINLGAQFNVTGTSNPAALNFVSGTTTISNTASAISLPGGGVTITAGTVNLGAPLTATSSGASININGTLNLNAAINCLAINANAGSTFSINAAVAATAITVTNVSAITSVTGGAISATSMDITGSSPSFGDAVNLTGALTIESGTTTLSAISGINAGTMTINSSTLNLGTNIALTGKFTVAKNAAAVVNGSTTTITGTGITLTSPSTLTNTGNTFTVTTTVADAAGCQLTNNSTGIINAGTSITLSSGNASSGTIGGILINAGAITASTTVTAGSGATLTNTGSLNVGTTLALSAGNATNGTAGGTLTNSGPITATTVTIGAGATLTNTNTISTTGLTASAATAAWPGGVLSNSGTINAVTVSSLNGSSFTNSGNFYMSGTAPAPALTITTPTTFSNSGLFDANGTTVKINGGTLDNASGGNFYVYNTSTISFLTASSPAITNEGNFYAGKSNSPCTVTMGVASASITNTGNFYLGSTSVMNVTIAGATVTNTSPGVFTIQSDAFGSGTIGKLTGSFTGTYNVQRYITGGSGFRGYRLLSSPVNYGGNSYYSLNYIINTSYLTGTTGTAGGFDATGNPTLYLYRENLAPSNSSFTSGNFRGINNVTASPNYSMDVDGGSFKIPVGNGLLFFYRGDRAQASLTAETTTSYVPTSGTLTSTGNLNQGNITVSNWWNGAANLLYTTTAGNGAVRGLNLVGNPYASSIDWDKFGTGITSTSVTGFIYVYDPSASGGPTHYNVYQNGTGGTGTLASASNIIPSGQGFFVQATAATATLTFTEAAKTNTQATQTIGDLFLGKPPVAAVPQLLRLKLIQNSTEFDGTIISFKGNANPGYVLGEDAIYKAGTGLLSLSSNSADSVSLAINSIPLPKLNPLTIPLNINAGVTGVFQLNLDVIKSIPDIYDVWVMDALTKDSLDIKHNPTYSFNIDKSNAASFGSNRLTLVIRENPALMVRLLNFTATKAANGAQVVWQTENEENYTNFTVQRSTNGGVTFKVLGGVSASGLGTYSFTDSKPADGTDQYRLMMQDLNGTITYSSIATLIYGNSVNNTANLNVYPNPSADVINLAIQNGASTQSTLGLAQSTTASYNIKIINITGSVVKSDVSTSTNWQGSVSGLLPGTYIIQVTDNSNNHLVGTNTFVKL